MDLDESPPAAPLVDRAKTAPFLIRTFVKIGSFHRLTLFEDGTFPTTDEQQLFTWKDATLREVLTTLRNTAPHVAEYRHPLARFSFRTVYADPSNKGRFSQKDLGMVYSRDILGEPGSLNNTAPRLLLDTDPAVPSSASASAPSATGTGTGLGTTRSKETENLDDLRFFPGDFLLVAVLLPKNVTLPSELSIKGSGANASGAGASSAPTASWKTGGGAGAGAGGGGPPGGGKADGGWGRGASNSGAGAGAGRGGGHWRGESNGPVRSRGGGRAGGADLGRDRDRDLDRDRVPPPRRSVSPPSRRGDGWGARGGRGGGRGGDRDRDRDRRTPSRSRSPPRRRNRYD